MKYILPAILGVLIVVLFGSTRPSSSSSTGAMVAQPHFNPDGSVNLPIGYREWSHVGTSLKTSGINVLDLSRITIPELLHAYVEPTAMASFEANGKWPDGTQIVKEYAMVRTGNGCDPQTHACETSFGKGIYESRYDGLALMVKDSKRFPDAPGHWAYFTFGHKPPPYDSTAHLLPKERCEFCHRRVASDTDYVVLRAHIGLAGKAQQ